MKKIFVVLLACALLMGLCAIPAAAADVVTVTVTADKTTAALDEEITFTISVSGIVTETTTAGIAIENWKSGVNSSFSYVTNSLTWLNEPSATAGKLSATTGKASEKFGTGEAVPNGAFASLKLKVKDISAGTCNVAFSVTGGAAASPAFSGTSSAITITLGSAASTEPEIAGATVIFNEDFESRYVVKAADVTGTPSFTINDVEAETNSVTIDGVQYYGALTPAVKPGAINTSFTVKFFVDGVKKDEWTTSIEERLKAAAAGTNATLANAAKATLAFCQKAAESVNKIDGTDYTTGVGTVDDYTGYTAIAPHGSGSGTVMIRGTSLYLKEGVFLNFYVDPQGTEYDASMKLSAGGNEYARTTTNGNFWVYSIPVELADMTTVFDATMVGVTSNTYSNSVVAYAKDLLDDPTTAELGQVIMNYVYYAKLATATVA